MMWWMEPLHESIRSCPVCREVDEDYGAALVCMQLCNVHELLLHGFLSLGPAWRN